MDESRDTRTLGQLFGDLSRQLSTLVRQEIDLARTEMTTKATTVGRDAALIGAGGAIAYGGVLVLLGALVLILVRLGLEGWLAALLVGVIAVVIGGLLAQQGRSRITTADVAPTRTIETLKDEAEWAKEQMR
jgi:hypothetical protein